MTGEADDAAALGRRQRRGLLGRAEDSQVPIDAEVVPLVVAPSLDHHEVQPLTAAEAQRILHASAGQRNAARWSVALALGLRQGEALGLKWDAVDLEAGTLAVRHALQRIRGKGLQLVPPESRAGRRVIAVPPQLVDALAEHELAQDAERQRAGGLWQEHGLVFTQPDGRPVDPRADWQAWKALLHDAGVRDARLHDARHTAATLTQGVPARVAMQIIGHSQISLTLGTYAHVVPELATEAAQRVGSALWGPAETTTETTTAAPREQARRSPRSARVGRQGIEP